MKPGILLVAKGNSQWIGGVYYIKNVAYQLTQNKEITNKYNIIVYTNDGCRDSFSNIDGIKVVVAKTDSTVELYYHLIRNHVRYRFPSVKDIAYLGCKGIAWIADFQQERMSEMFPAENLQSIRNERMALAKGRIPLILSSEDALNDFCTYYSKEKTNISVMHFVSYVEPEIRSITPEYEKNVLNSYQLNGKYVYIANQFWKHKNHIVVFNAIKKLIETNGQNDVKFIFSGKMHDYRNPEYIEELEKLFVELSKDGKVVNLGFLDRMEQLVIMKNSEFMIQPSLFEGWGTVLEDAKVLDKTVLLSDIPVHREQKSDKCIMFDLYNSDKLAELIRSEIQKKHNSDIEYGIKRMKQEAYQYSKAFQEIL